MDFDLLFHDHKEPVLNGRYIAPEHIEPLLKKFKTEIIGLSVLEKPIYAFQVGTGKTRIMMWSQMHGNEGTTTKALFDFVNVLHGNTEIGKKLLGNFTFCCLPMVNPDGSKVYTRENANGIDLNRDAQMLTQPESIALRKAFDDFKPHYCYNLHDQRTIYGAGATANPATVSFLAPAYNREREMNDIRRKAIHVIVAMDKTLQQFIPNQVGRFDDAFNLNCIGDTFQFMNVPTILFEAGHFQGDYEREMSRKFIFIALLSGLNYINENVIVSNEIDYYLNIPQNKVVFYDIVYKNIKINYDSNEIITNFAVQYQEELIEGQVSFSAYFAEIGDLDNYFGHFEFDAKGATYSDGKENIPKLNQKADFYLDKNIKVVNGMVNI
ncbi:MAG TPA: M14 family zinc carboxypeptidase [Flavobacterium sp.]|nr:M14 family zinc carboxypeptidase [Flavobacterium sp.]